MINPFHQTVKSESGPLIRIVIISGKTNKKKETSLKQGLDIQISKKLLYNEKEKNGYFFNSLTRVALYSIIKS